MLAGWCVHRCLAGGVVSAVSENLLSCYNDMWRDLEGAPSPAHSYRYILCIRYYGVVGRVPFLWLLNA